MTDISSQPPCITTKTLKSPLTAAAIIFTSFSHVLRLAVLLLLFLACLNYAWATEEKAQLADALMVSEHIGKKFILADNNRLSDPKLFRQLLAELYQLRKHFTPSHQQYFTYLQGYHFAYIGEHDKAEQKLKAVLQSTADKLLKFRVNHTLINLSAINHKWADGLKYIADNNAVIASIKSNKYIQSSILATTIFYIQLKQYELALKHIEQLEQHDLTPYTECFANQYYFEAKYKLAQLSISNNKIMKAINLCTSAGNKIGANSIRRFKARLYLQVQQPEQALALLLPHLDEVKSTLFPMLIAALDNIIAKAYYQLNDMNNAKHYANKAIGLNKHNTGIERGRDSYQILYQVAEQQHDFTLALRYFKKYAQLDKTYLDEVNAKHIAFQLAEHDSLEQNSKIKLLNEQNELLTTKQVLTDAKIHNVQLAITVLILLLILISVWGARLWRKHKRVKILSESDELTGIYNRRHFNYIAVSALRYCKTAKQDLSVIMFDLDHFKRINDNYGHICGDWALQETIKVCQAIGKSNDVFARLGGEEFCLLLPSTSIDEAYIRAEACRHAIAGIISEASGYDFSLSASFGITDIKSSGFRLTDLLKDADSAMYLAKDAGRNQVVLFTPLNKVESLDNSWSVTS